MPFVNVSNGCATGGSALTVAAAMIEAAGPTTAVAVGFDKHPKGAFNADPADWGLAQWYGETGMMLTTQFFAMKIQRYLHDHGIDQSILAKVAREGVRNGALNANAWRRAELTEEEIAGSRDGQPPADPVHVLLAGRGRGGARARPRRPGRTSYRDPPVHLRSAALQDAPVRLVRGVLAPLAIDRAGSPTVRRGRGLLRAGRHRPG